MSSMEQAYSHHHLTDAHHHGLVAGTLFGSLAVTLLIAIAVVVVNPNLISHPLSYTSQLFGSNQTNQPVPLGSTANDLSTRSRQAATGSAVDIAIRQYR